MNKNVRNLRDEVSRLKNQLNELNVQKEQWFSTKERLKKDISELIQKIRIFKSTKDKTDIQARDLKKKRDDYNKQVQDLIKKFKELNSKKQNILKAKQIKFDPATIIKKIEELDFKLETEAISFTKEKQMMVQIKAFKKQLNEVGETQSLFKELKALSEEITATKTKADEAHQELQKAGQTGYDELMEMTKKINDLKKKQEDAFKKFIESKDKFSKINEELKTKLKQANELNLVKKIKTLETQEKKLEDRAKEVEEKLKQKKKLTTEDLIILQGQK